MNEDLNFTAKKKSKCMVKKLKIFKQTGQRTWSVQWLTTKLPHRKHCTYKKDSNQKIKMENVDTVGYKQMSIIKLSVQCYSDWLGPKIYIFAKIQSLNSE